MNEFRTFIRPLRCLTNSESEEGFWECSAIFEIHSLQIRLCICVSNKVREIERELLLRLIVTMWVVEARAVGGDGGWRWRRGVVCIVLYMFDERTVWALGRWRRGKETMWTWGYGVVVSIGESTPRSGSLEQ